MPSIDIRKSLVNGLPSYRVRIRPLDKTEMQLTFHDLKQAEQWLADNQDDYYSDPTPYLAWLKANRESMRRNGIFHNHIPLEKFT